MRNEKFVNDALAMGQEDVPIYEDCCFRVRFPMSASTSQTPIFCPVNQRSFAQICGKRDKNEPK